MIDKCFRCKQIKEVSEYKDKELVCDSCQRIWLEMCQAFVKIHGTLNPYSEAFKKLRKEFLNNFSFENNPSSRYNWSKN